MPVGHAQIRRRCHNLFPQRPAYIFGKVSLARCRYKKDVFLWEPLLFWVNSLAVLFTTQCTIALLLTLVTMIGKSRSLCLVESSFQSVAISSWHEIHANSLCTCPILTLSPGVFFCCKDGVKRQIQGPLQPSLIFHVFSETGAQHLLQ